MTNDIFEKFTEHCRQALKNAFGLALACGHRNIGPEHILYGISQQKGSIGGEILAKAKIDSLKIKQVVGQEAIVNPRVSQVGLTVAGKKLLEKSFLLASLNKHPFVGTEHLLSACLDINDQKINELLAKNGADLMAIRTQLGTALNSSSKFSDLNDYLEAASGQPDEPGFVDQRISPQPSALDFFATNLTDPNVQNNIDPLIGRQEEINRLIQILSRRNKNNPILLGDPGVGKTAIVEGLAKKIVKGEVPELLLNKKIYALDLTLVVAGTSFRGEFENRLKQIINEVKKNPNIILFIDEVHNIIGAGSAAGSMDAANILKPALARGEIRCIGATTLEEYKKNIESDPALERRFQSIQVNQPTVEKTIDILKGIKTNYEIFHQVKINDSALEAAAKLSERYLTDRFLPDKAIDLIDEAAAALKIKQSPDGQLKKIFTLENQLTKIQQKKQQNVENEKFNSALGYQKQEQIIVEQINQIKASRLAKQIGTMPEITQFDISSIVSKITGIPTTELIKAEKERLLKLEIELGKRIIGQPAALKSVAELIRRSRTGIGATNRPIGSFIFLGPSGVGKTESAKVIAEQIFGSPEALIRIDMAEFGESFNASKLIGAPAGYIGYKEGAKLTDAVKRRPYSVVLFDEIEKAHPQIFNLLLSILEDGYITDARGKKIDFKNTIIIMTSNLGSSEFNQPASLGFDAKTSKEKQAAEQSFELIQRQITKKLKEQFRPEFLNRLDQIIVFRPLDLNSVAKITQLQLQQLQQRLKKQDLALVFKPEVTKLIAKISYAPEVGARAVRKTIQDLIENKIANKILAKNHKKITVGVENEKITI